MSTNKQISKYEKAFNRWERLKRTNAFIIWFEAGMTLMMYGGFLSQLITEERLTFSVVVSAIVLLTVAILFLFIIYKTIKYDRIKFSKDAAIYATREAIVDLDNCDRVRASLVIDKLIRILCDFLNLKTIRIGEELYKPCKFSGVNTPSLLKRNISLFIQTKCNISELKTKLYKVSSSLEGNLHSPYRDVSDLLVWLDLNTKDIGSLTPSFIEKHPLFIPVLIPILGIAVTLITQLINIFFVPK